MNDQVSLRDVIHRLSIRGFSDISVLLDQDAGSENQKIQLMETLYSLYILSTKILILLRFSNKFPNVNDVLNYITYANGYNLYLQTIAQNFEFFAQDLPFIYREPFYDIPAAIDILVGGAHSRLPISVYPLQNRFIPQKELSFYFHFLEDFCRVNLLRVNVPSSINVSLDSGRLLLECPDVYTAFLTIDRSRDFVVTSFRLPNFSTERNCPFVLVRKEKMVISPFSESFLLQKVNELIKNANSAEVIHSFMKKVFALFNLMRILSEGKEAMKFLPIYVEIVNNRIKISFWELVGFVVCDGNNLRLLLGNHVLGECLRETFEQILQRLKNYASYLFLKKLQKDVGGELVDGEPPILSVFGVEVMIHKNTAHFCSLTHSHMMKYLNVSVQDSFEGRKMFVERAKTFFELEKFKNDQQEMFFL